MNRRKMLALSFDDGTIQDRRLVALLNRFGLKGTFNLNSGLFGMVHNIECGGITVCHDELHREEIRELYQGHEIAVHTVTHPNLIHCTEKEIIREVMEDYTDLSELTDVPLIGMAYPGGGVNYRREDISVLTAHTVIRFARTTCCHGVFRLPDDFMEWHPTCHCISGSMLGTPDLLKLAQQFAELEPEEDSLFLVWGHSFEFDKNDCWQMWDEFCTLIGNCSDVTSMTCGDVYRLYNT